MATWNSDGSVANIQALHDQAATHDGDIITLPNGTFSWTTQLTLTKAITLQGNTTTNPTAGTAVQNTIVQDNIANRSNHIIYCNGGSGGWRITGIAFVGVATGSMFNGAITVDHNVASSPIRIDHCYFHGLHCYPTIGIFDPAWGSVIDHCVKDDTVTGNEGFCHYWPGSHTDLGDSMFQEAAGFGGSKFLFLEDNYMNGGMDLTAGGKACVRHCIIVGNNSLGEHGTSRTFQSGRGGRAYEVYNCQFRYDNNFSSIDGPDGGSAVYHDNTVQPHTRGISSQVYRIIYTFGTTFGGASGLNNWDYNATESDGTHVNGHSPFAFESGTFSGGTGGSTLIDSTKTWTPANKWAGYAVSRTSDGATAVIKTSSTNTLTVGQWNDQGFASGQAYKIGKPLRILDQPGLGAGDAINRASPAWLNQVDEPMYSWNNTNTDDSTEFGYATGDGGPTILQNRDYYNSTPMPGYTPYTYPHPLTGGATGKIINLTGTSSYGTAIVGTNVTGVLHVNNSGDTLLTVTAVSYPTAFSGATGGFTVAAGATTDITVTFTPAAAISYSGNITVTSDATSGTNTFAVTGQGQNPTPTPHGHRKPRSTPRGRP